MHINLDLDDTTKEWISEVADLLHISPAQLIASIVRDVAADDTNAHLEDYHSECLRLN